ncbi:hypothetical protein [Actinomadura napierensis]|uniref:Uncharacterized protein n=1 Tax=Actinomadura napierensis TaxID=267854 RepID=A0ABN3A014_9ACTN
MGKDDEGHRGPVHTRCRLPVDPLADPHVSRVFVAAYWRKVTRTQEDFDLRFGVPVLPDCRATVE